MRCPWCALEAPARALHAHLVEVHREEVRIEERLGLPFYVVACPLCSATYEAPIKPRGRDSGFLQEFRREISLVGFDMLVNHLVAEHGATRGPAGPMSGRDGGGGSHG